MNKYNDYLIQENIVNISLMAGHLITNKRIEVENSSELTEFIIEKAKEFESLFGEEVRQREEYFGHIDEFAEQQLIERYGKIDDE
jgi:hypothetical protein